MNASGSSSSLIRKARKPLSSGPKQQAANRLSSYIQPRASDSSRREDLVMTRLGSRQLWCVFLLLLAALPVLAQDSREHDPLIAPIPLPNAIPEGQTILLRLNDNLDTSKMKQGQRFTAKVAEDLVAPNGATIRHGQKVWGHVSSVEQGLHARMLLSFDEIDTGHGSMPLIATVTGVPGEHAVKQPDAEGEIERKGMSKRHMIEAVAVGAGIGAVGGGAAAGSKGAAIGAGAGAGAGALGGFLTDRNIKLDKGTTLEVRLDRPLQVPR